MKKMEYLLNRKAKTESKLARIESEIQELQAQIANQNSVLEFVPEVDFSSMPAFNYARLLHCLFGDTYDDRTYGLTDEDKMELDRIIDENLGKRRALIIKLRFRENSLSSIGGILGVGKEAIRKQEAKALRMMLHPSRWTALRHLYAPYEQRWAKLTPAVDSPSTQQTTASDSR